jgi:hypothetical protein
MGVFERCSALMRRCMTNQTIADITATPTSIVTMLTPIWNARVRGMGFAGCGLVEPGGGAEEELVVDGVRDGLAKKWYQKAEH